MTSIRMKLTPHLKLYTVRSRQLANVFGRIIVMFQGLSMHLANEIANTCGTQEHLIYAKSCQKDIFLDNFENDFANVM